MESVKLFYPFGYPKKDRANCLVSFFPNILFTLWSYLNIGLGSEPAKVVIYIRVYLSQRVWCGYILALSYHSVFFKPKRISMSWAAEPQRESERPNVCVCVCVHIDVLWRLRLSIAQEKRAKLFGIFLLLTDKFPRNCNHNSWKVVKQESITKVGVVNQRNLESLRI